MISKRLFHIFIIATLCAGCKSHDSRSSSDIDTGLLDYFSATNNCKNIWFNLTNDWVNENGSGFSSIARIRDKIEQDEVTKLSKLIRENWAFQDALNQFVSDKEMGAWPVSNEAYRQATALLFLNEYSGIPAECMLLNYLEPSIHNMFDGSLNDIAELGVKELQPPYDKKWAIYWLFVNAK
ncbi:hypothetical protein [Rheinheimera sp.]|uniref:hypothetical protein n=1 Tax=Rheinheimera sp. TaxID=1869214 RepID=UPI00404886C7